MADTDNCGRTRIARNTHYGRKVWHSNSKHRKYIWRCNQKYDTQTTCSTPNLDEPAIKAAFVEAFNQMLGDKEQYISRFEEMLPLLADTTELEAWMAEAQTKHDGIMDILRRYMEENTRQIQDQEEYNRRFSELDAECKKAEEEIAAIQKELLTQSGRKEQIRRCLDKLQECGDILEEFDLDLWNSMVDTATVTPDKKLTFLFRDNTKISVKVP